MFIFFFPIFWILNDLNCFCGMVHQQKAFIPYFQMGLLSEILTLQISNMLWPGFEPVQNLSSDIVEWNCAVVITTTPQCHLSFVVISCGCFLSAASKGIFGVFLFHSFLFLETNSQETWDQKIYLKVWKISETLFRGKIHNFRKRQW